MDANIALLEADVWKFLEVSLENGTGLTLACEGMNISIQAMSKFLAEKPGTLDKLTSGCVMGYKAIMTMINNGAADQKMKTWKDGHVALREFVRTVNLWEQHCKKADVTPDAVAEAFYTYSLIREVATVTGHTLPEFYRYVLGDRNLKAYLIRTKFITG